MNPDDERLELLAHVVTERIPQLGDTIRDVAFRAKMSETSVRKVTKQRGALDPEKLADLSEALGWDRRDLDRLMHGETTTEELLARVPDGVPPNFKDAPDIRRIPPGEYDELVDARHADVREILRDRYDQTRSALVSYLERRGFTISPPEDTPIGLDVSTQRGDETWAIQVKTITIKKNTRNKVHAALAELLDYGHEAGADHLVLFTDFELDEEYVELLRRNNIRCAWPGDWTALESTTTERGNS